MHVDPDLVRTVVGFITGGGLLAFISTAVKVYRAVQSGIPVREQRVRLDIVKQRDLALGYAHDLREDLLAAGVHPAALRPWPSALKELP